MKDSRVVDKKVIHESQLRSKKATCLSERLIVTLFNNPLHCDSRMQWIQGRANFEVGECVNFQNQTWGSFALPPSTESE